MTDALVWASWVGAIGAMGVVIFVGAVLFIIWRERELRGGARAARKRGHDTKDATCLFWWGDRHGSITARCPICNPVRGKHGDANRV